MDIPQVGKPHEVFNLGIRYFVWFICVVTWIVVGFIYWVPLLLKGVLNYMISLSATAFNPDLSIDKAEQYLEFSIAFYANGFMRINATLNRTQETKHKTSLETTGSQIWTFVRETIFSLLVWLVGLLLIGVVEINPSAIIDNIGDLVSEINEIGYLHNDDARHITIGSIIPAGL